MSSQRQSKHSSPSFSDHRIPSRDECVLRYLMDRYALEKPDDTFIVFENGDSLNYAQIRDEVVNKAAGIQQLGVKQGDHVAVWLPNGKESLISFFAINYLGAVYVPFNTAYKGKMLEHVLANSDAKVIIAHQSLVQHLKSVALASLERLVRVGESEDGFLQGLNYQQLSAPESSLQALEHPIEPWHTQSIIYTSGTTGPSKGVLSSYLHMVSNAGPESWHFITAQDRFLINMPMFHIGGMGIAFTMFVRGASIAMMENFSTSTFWDFVRRSECTAVFLLGVMASFLLKQPASQHDKAHKVRLAFMVPLTQESHQVHDRFGIDVYTIFNMTEVSSPIVSKPNPEKTGTCGKVRDGVQVRLVDENDCEVALGQVGEMIVRTDRPWAMNSGYYKNPQATARAWRNGWFHTGDSFRRDDQGYYFFVDRVKDAIRRRGENISSFEVEAEVIAHPDVQEVAAIGVPSQLSEDDVMIVVAPVAGRQINPRALIEFLQNAMPHFMVPRYIRIKESLPKTPTAKVQKAQLREQGVTTDTWDREVEGIKIRRPKI
jgi:carnitine-CoA ligase